MYTKNGNILVPIWVTIDYFFNAKLVYHFYSEIIVQIRTHSTKSRYLSFFFCYVFIKFVYVCTTARYLILNLVFI